MCLFDFSLDGVAPFVIFSNPVCIHFRDLEIFHGLLFYFLQHIAALASDFNLRRGINV